MTENGVYEAVYYQGNSINQEIFDLLLRLLYLDLRGCFKWHIYVSGTRNIASGTDGFSRWYLIESISTTVPNLYFVQLNNTVFENSPMLVCWVQNYIGLKNI